MDHPNPEIVRWASPRGEITLRSFCREQDISACRLPDTFGKYARYRPIVSSTDYLVKAAGRPDANVVLACNEEREIVGIAILQYPHPEERWARVGQHVMMEVSAVEVGRSWRHLNLGSRLLDRVLDHPLKEDRILYMVGYSWTWDLAGLGKTAVEYRNILIHMFARRGFCTYQTNDPNVSLRPENLFMARIGERVSPDLERRFKLVRFNLDPD